MHTTRRTPNDALTPPAVHILTHDTARRTQSDAYTLPAVHIAHYSAIHVLLSHSPPYLFLTQFAFLSDSLYHVSPTFGHLLTGISIWQLLILASVLTMSAIRLLENQWT